MTFKQQVHEQLQQAVNQKIIVLNAAMAALSASAANETKSTAGDKYETALAMLQIEQANLRIRLANLLQQKLTLENINANLTTIKVVIGSLVKTNNSWFFISIPLTKVLVGNIIVTAISLDSPLGSQLHYKQKGESVLLNGKTFIVEDIF
jgi:transcription elongation GreA/GreB family factor